MRRILGLFVFLATTTAYADWVPVADGIDYQRVVRDGLDAHVVRIDVTMTEWRTVATRRSERGLTVSDFAKKNDALVAINADYFDEAGEPVGMAMGACGIWAEAKPVRKQPLLMVGESRAEIVPPGTAPAEWVQGAVAGWPLLITGCESIEKLPGSDFFTLAPHPRTAVALSKDGETLYFVATDGRREGVPGLTLPELAKFLRDELDACEALNLDGGGSTAMWVTDKIVNQPSDGQERKVGNHLAVVAAADYEGCDERRRLEKD